MCSGLLPTSLPDTRHACETLVRRGRGSLGWPAWHPRSLRQNSRRHASPLNMATHRAWRLRSRPVGALKDSDLELVTEPKPSPGDGQLLVKTLWASIDPTHRIWMSDKPQVCCA
jgi:hypothetical protein